MSDLKAMPTRFGNYFLLDRIDVGGMAEVFRAKSCDFEGFDRLIAVKRILSSISSNREFVDMFVNEAKLAVQLNHPNIAQIFDLGHVETSYYIAMEYVHGKDLRQVYDRCQERSTRMPAPIVCHALMKVCEGLQYAHNKRDDAGRPMCLVHRDVSPQNVVVSYDGEVKLIDFGVAKAAGNAGRTQAGVLKGKFAYMSPEQVRGLPLDRRSDIFSVGVILFEFLSGSRLFWGETDFSTLEQVRTAKIPSPRALNPELDEALESIVFRALAKDVDDRYQNTIDLHDDLQAYLYSKDLFCSARELAASVTELFRTEIAAEGERLTSYRRLSWHDTVSPHSALSGPMPDTVPGAYREAPMDPSETATPQLSGSRDGAPADIPTEDSAAEDDVEPYSDDVETQIFDKPEASVALDDPLVLHDAETPPLEAAEVPEDAAAVPRDEGAADDDAVAEMADAEPEQDTAAVELPPVVAAKVPRPPRRRRRLSVVLAITTLLLGAGVALLAFALMRRTGSLEVTSKPPGARLYVDGRRQPGSTPLTVAKLQRGVYVVSVRKTGYDTWAKAVDVSAGGESRILAELQELPLGSVEVRTQPRGARVTFDGRQLEGKTPLEVGRVPPGRHEIALSGLPEYAPLAREIDVRPKQRLTLSFALNRRKVRLEVSSRPTAATVLLRDGAALERLGRSPIVVQVEPREGRELVIRRRGYAEWSRPLRFQGKPTLRIAAELERRR